jgi:hypothetical protein
MDGIRLLAATILWHRPQMVRRHHGANGAFFHLLSHRWRTKIIVQSVWVIVLVAGVLTSTQRDNLAYQRGGALVNES